MGKTLAEKWVQIFRIDGGPWPEDGHWPERWYAIEREMKCSGDVASAGGGGYESEENEGSELGTPYVFNDNSGFLLSGGDDKGFPAIRVFSEAEISNLQVVWDHAKYLVIDAPKEIKWLEKHVAQAEESPNRPWKTTRVPDK